MIDISPRKQLGLIDYSNLPADCIYIGRLPSPFSDLANGREMIVDFFVAKGLVVNRRERRINGLVDSAINQFEIPLTGIKWMIEAIEQGFEQPPSAGGLAKNTLHMDVCINDEELRLEYGVSVGGEGVGGYTVVNFDRSSYIIPRYSQEFSITVGIWREFGRDFFKTLQKRIEAGEFN
jgi:hypothetical protein